ncbi:conjugative transfer signal peptidase TraF [Allosphingosinicella indica]|uniref:Conjugative transfer signal peptidase TraF n=2 Tax=Allosphingosinicella indica TaxID=941907 RepID=A0A1X7FZM4_9SPHN|nr:conjugative transfer signal peptidase TraF [Allosphingosinicella indica]
MAALSVPSVLTPSPGLLWNASASVPTGLYVVTKRAGWRKGDLVAARLPAASRTLASARNYLPAGLPALKRVAAISPDHLCARSDRLFVNGALVALRRSADRAGRALPHWQGCRRLAPDELLLLAPASHSFDGRYFGPSHRRDIIGLARKW